MPSLRAKVYAWWWFFAEGTFTIALIAAMMGERVVQAAKTIK
ncbi:MAG: hypothetical protein O3B20_08095 [Bacteroidetes bacterium]|nr:hypothetical protein [Bacteroidota bacterium]